MTKVIDIVNKFEEFAPKESLKMAIQLACN